LLKFTLIQQPLRDV